MEWSEQTLRRVGMGEASGWVKTLRTFRTALWIDVVLIALQQVYIRSAE
jgi:hypothetical protein